MEVKTLTLIDTIKKMYPVAQFFKNRYFPDAGCFYSEKALIEMKRGNRKVAPFVAPVANGIVIEKEGYTAEYVDAPYIAPKSLITPKDLEKKAFGENPDSGRRPADRENELEAEIMDDLRCSILRRHELMCSEIITTGRTIMKHYSTAQDAANDKNAQLLALTYYGPEGFQNKYKFKKDFKTMTAGERIATFYEIALILQKRGVTTSDIVMTGDVSMLLMTDKDFLEFYNKKAVENGEIKQKELPDGVSFNGTININGIMFNMFTYSNQYEDLDGEVKEMFPKGTIAFLQPGMGKTVYAQVTFASKGTGFKSLAEKIVPRVVIDENNNIVTVQEFSRPVPYPKDPEGWMVANINDEVGGESLRENSTPVVAQAAVVQPTAQQASAAQPVDGGVQLKSEAEINAMKKEDLVKYAEAIGAPINSDMKVDELKSEIIAYQESLE